MTRKTLRMRALDTAWLAFGVVVAAGFVTSSVQSETWFVRLLTAAFALVVIFGIARYVREVAQTRWQHPDDTQPA